MSFQNAYQVTTAAIDFLRSQMNVACNHGLTTLAAALFAAEPNVTWISWSQKYDATSGFTLGMINYSSVGTIEVRAVPHMAGAAIADPIKQFAAFVRSIDYHLFCVYGSGVTVTITREGITTKPF